jgi:hypothetical protein
MNADLTPAMVHPWRRRRAFLWALLAVGLAALSLGWLMPLALAGEPATPMPYTWPAHQAIFLHTATHSAKCTITEKGVEIDHVEIPTATPLPFTGVHLAPRASGPATVTCPRYTTVTVDPDLRYSLAGSQVFKLTLTVIGVLSLTWVLRRRHHLRRPRRFVRGAG